MGGFVKWGVSHFGGGGGLVVGGAARSTRSTRSTGSGQAGSGQAGPGRAWRSPANGEGGLEENAAAQAGAVGRLAFGR